MLEAPIPANDSLRLEALKALNILDTPPEDRFDRITELASQIFDVPIALVSLVDINRQWFKSCIGLDVSETDRNISFCGHAIHSREILQIPDTLQDPRFADNPLVTGPPHIRFYAGAPLSVDGENRVGTLCMIDRRPRAFGPTELRQLRLLADCAERELVFTNMVSVNRMMTREREFKSQFVATVSHELRTPVTAMLGALDILRKRFSEALGEEGENWLDMATRNGRRLSTLVNDILDIEQIGEGMLRLGLERLPVRPLLEEALQVNRSYGDDLGIELKLAGVIPDVEILVDPDRFQQVMANLISNAIKHSFPGGVVEIHTGLHYDAEGKDEIRIQVVDYGEGIAKRDINHIFERFYRSETGNVAGKISTGLGLAITKSLVERMEGHISVESQRGKGARFIVHLPLASGREDAKGRDQEV